MTHFIQACADDYFVAKYDSNVKFIWVKSFCGSYSAISVGLQTDDNKNVFVAGNFIGKVDFNPGPGKANVISKGINDIFIVKLDSNGKFIWVKTFGGKKNDQINSMKIDRFGNIYTIGSFEDKVDFDPAKGIFIDSVMGGSDTFISKLVSGGNFIWAKSFKGIYDEWGFDLDVDSAGNVYSIGVFFDSVDFNPDTTNFSMKSAGFMDVFISKLDSSGNFVWAKSIGGGSNDWGLRIALDASEVIFISGHFYGTSDLNPGVGVYNAVSPINNLDIFIVKLEGSGDFIKAYTFGDLGSDVISGIAIDKKNVYAVGTFWGVVDFDPGAGVSLLTGSNTKGTIFLLKLSQTSTGIFQINQSQNFSIYPNPSNGNFTINVKNKNATNFEIYNVMGEKIFSTKLINPKTEIELKAKPGMYFYQIKNDNGIIENSKIVIQ